MAVLANEYSNYDELKSVINKTDMFYKGKRIRWHLDQHYFGELESNKKGSSWICRKSKKSEIVPNYRDE